ncbi:MAG: DUF4468 domain-containing protein [Dysgonamonadaceae bacterium]|jgi:hypothetical protein|nr:DUF4468 domain-containing protein [Dysgonamonadaceae bacterium]MDD3356521.1 DUF4468 domain-containing protein [Dysgonamonadaceae bacterium]MDD3728365.1 DUF4468 domain-containing protein [Dysgonamonadaceae bacterium]MDD4246355.1 DUF4468 domain-containing protein [Dysgonamonadaceae bacterium]MDD4606028.1 DUF4468 domain-containing protein [Dysgonamonadaceae bacterium]
MKRILFIIGLIFAVLGMNAQTQKENVFTSVPEVNGKVVFQQFIHTHQGLSEDQNYAILYKWGKDNYAGNPLLSGIRFNEKDKSLIVSSKVELLLPENSKGVREKMIMNYRFDANITSAGCILVVRNITYQNVEERGKSFFPKSFSAEEMITDNAVNSNSDNKELKVNLRKGTLYFLNELYNDLKESFSVS